MGLFTFTPKIDEGVAEFRATPNALLVDVRTPEEYAEGHIPGSVNIPLAALPARMDELGELDRPLFVHCLSGGRSGHPFELGEGPAGPRRASGRWGGTGACVRRVCARSAPAVW